MAKAKRFVEKNISYRGERRYRVKIMRSGHAIDKTFDTLEEAKIFRDLTFANASIDSNEEATYLARAKKLENKSYTLSDAIKDYRTKKSEKKRGSDKEKSSLDKLSRSPQAPQPLYQLKAEHILELLEWIRTSGSKKRPDLICTEATLHRYLNLIQHIFQIAVDEWKKIETNPCLKIPKSARPKDGLPRDRRLRGDEYEKMMEQLPDEPKLYFIIAIETSMRRGEILQIKWENIDLINNQLLIKAITSKVEKSRTIPISEVALNFRTVR